MKNYLFLLFSLSFLFIQCKTATQKAVPESTNSAYQKEIQDWRKKRFENLTAAKSWSSLAGLIWLKEGENKFGSAKSNQVVFPEKAPDVMGSMFKKGDSVFIKIANNLAVKIGNSIITESPMIPDVTGSPTVFNYESLIWNLIKREEKYGIRLWDTLHENRKLAPLKHFEIQEKWNVPAKFIKYENPKTVPYNNVLSMTVEQKIEGKLAFEMNGKTFELEVLNGGPKSFFVIFADETTSETTYGGGRYIYVSRPDENGNTFIDFNKAYTPPCGFTDYATCLLPNAENILELKIEAGEKYEGHH